MNTRVDKFQKRTHYKMYKAGKRWLVAGMATFALASAGQIVTGHAPINFGQDIIAHAADSSTNYWFGQNADYYKRYTELPGQTSIPQSLQQKWGYAGAEIPKLQEQTNLKFDSLSYDTTTGLYTLTIKMNVPVLATNGAGRTSYLDLGFSDSLSAKTAGIPSLIAANGNPGTLAANGNGVFSNNFSAGSYVGGTSTVSIQINPVKIQKNDEISVMYSSDTGTTGYHAIFSTVRTMGYNEFGLQFNQTLLKQMKTNSTNNISSSKLSTKQKVAEQAKVDSVTTDDDFVNKLQDIDKEIDTKSKANAVPIDTQRATALQQYKDAHHVDEWLAKIKNDPTLTFDQKTAQSKQIEDALAIINGNLGNATDSDDVAAVIADTSQDDVIASAYKPGVDLASQIKSAQAAVDEQVAKSKELVDNNNALTEAEKSTQNSTIDAIGTAVKNNIATKASADDINATQAAGVKNLTDLDTAKPNAYTTLTDKAKAAIATINNDENLTDAEKATKKSQVTDALKKLTDQIDQATDASVIDSLKNSPDLDTAIATATSNKGITPIGTRREDANRQINQAVSDTKAKINQDPTLTTQEKATQSANVDKAAAEAKAAIASGSAQVVADAVSKAQGEIAGSYVAGKPLPDRQQDAEKDLQATAETAKHNLDDQVAQTNNDVNNNHYLTDDEKAAQKQAIEKAAEAILAKINNATNADDINTLLNDGKSVVGNLNSQKLDARTTINNAAQGAKAKINNNNALTADEKRERVNQIEAAQTAANQAVDAATDADVIAKIPANGSDFDKSVKNATDFSNVTSLNDQQANAGAAVTDAGQKAKDALDAAKTASENSINQDGSLTFEQKAMQKTAIDAAVTNAKRSIASTTNADDVVKARDLAVAAISKMTSDKVDARQSLAKNAQDAIDKINQYDALTSDEKRSRVQQIQDAYDKATTAVDSATDSQVIASVKDATGFTNTVAKATDFSNVLSLADQKTAADKQIDDITAVIKANIDADTNLSSEDKTTQKSTIDAVAASKKNVIDSATNADGIVTAKNVAVQTINGLDKTNADKAVSDQASSAHVKINGNPALTQVQKDAFNKQIDDAEQTAQSNVNNATDSSTVASLIDSQNSDYAKQLQNVLTQAGQALSIQAQQTAANQAIDNTNTAAKAKVDADPALADADKQAQKATLDKVANQAKQAVQQAATADAVNQAQVDGVNALNRLDKAKADETIASKAKDASDQVNNNPALSDNEKANRNDKIKAAIREVQDKVNQATTPEEVNAAIADTSDFSSVLANATNMDNIETIAQQQTDAKKAIDAANATAKAKVDADTNLSDADKAAQKATLDSLANAAKQNIQNAQTANDITKAQNTGVKSLNDLDKTTADKQLSDKVAQAHATVNSDNDLLQAEKDARNQAIDAATKTVQDTINKATTLDDIAKALANGADFDSAINKASSTTEVKPLAVQKATAAKAINDAVDTARAKIKADSNLSDADKKAQAATIDDLANKAKANIDAATNADGVVAAKTTGVGSITNLDKTSVDANLAKQAQVAHAEVNNNPALSSAEKQRRNQAIDDAAKAAQDVVNKATTIDDANTVISSGNTLDNALKSATSSDGVKTIAGQQVDAGTEIDNAAAKAKQAIDADKTLTDVDKQAQKDVINSQADMFKKAINAANNADDISKNTAAGVKFLQDLTDAKTQANAKLASDVQNAHDAVNNNKTLSQAQKDARNKQIEDAKTAAQDVINKATTLDGVDGALADGSDYDKAMKNAQDISNVSSIADQQKAAIVAIQQAADAAKQVVNADTNLSDTDKQAQKDALDIVANQAKTAIQQAATADDINQAQDNGINALSNMDKTANDKSAAKQATDAHATINGNPALTQAQKDGFNKQIDNAKNAAQEIVNKATDPSTASAAVDTLNSDYAKQLQNILTNASSIPSLDSQKTTANQAIDNAANTVKSGIDADKNLSDADKTAQKTVVDSQVTAAKQAIADANDADNVNTAQAQGVKAINDLANVKTSADDMIVKAAKTAHDAINNNPALSTAEKASRNAAIDTAASKVQGVVNQATTPDAVNAAIADSSEFKVALTTATDTNGVETIEQQQADAKKAIDAANATAKAKVDTDTNLSDADKAAQKATLDSLANAAKQNIQNAQTADDITKAQNVGVKALQDLTNAKTEANAKLASDVQNAHDAVNTNKALTTAQKAERNQAIDEAQKNTQDAINQATTPSSAKNAGLNIADSLAKVIATDGIPSVAEQQKAAIAAIQQTADQAKQTIDVDKTLTGAQKNDQKAAIDDIVKSATDAINQAMDADSINKIQINMTDALNNIHDQKADALSKLQKQADDANHAIDANNALTTDQKQAAHEAVAKALTNAQAVTDHTTNAEDVVNSGNQAAYNKALQDIADDLAKVPSLVDQVHAAIEKLTEAVNKAKDALSGPDAGAQKMALEKVLSDGTAKLNAQTNADDLKKTLVDVLNTVNGLNQSKTDALTDLDTQSKKATDTVNADPSFTDDEKATRVAAVAKALQDAHDAINEAIDLPGVDAARKATAFSETLKDATSDAGVQTLADRKTDAKKTLQDAADKTKSAIDADKTLTIAQKTAQKQAINQALKIAQNQVDAATTATKVDVSKATNLPTFDALNKAKSDAHQTENKTYNDTKKAIQNNNDLTDAEKQVRISDLDKAHQLASDAIDQAVTPDEIKTANETTAFDNAVKSATDFSKVTPLAERKQAGVATINAAEQKAIDEVNANPKLDADAKTRQIAVLKQQAQAAIAKLDDQANAQAVVDFIPTVVPTFEKLNQSKVDARARLQNNAATTKAAIDADDNLSNAQKQDQKDGVDAALKQAVIDVDNGQDVLTINGIPDGSTAVKKINQGHVRATKTPAQQEEELNEQIDDQAAKVKAEIDADVTLRDAEKSAQKHTIDSFVAETKAKIAGLTKYQDRLDVVNQSLDLLKNLHQQGKPLTEQKSDAITTIDQMAYQIRTQIANDSRLTKAQKDADYQLVEGAVAKAKSQVNAALNADEIVAGLDYGTVQLEAAYQQKVQEQYDEKQSTTPETISVLPQTGETEKKHEEALVAEALVDSMAGFFLSKINRRRQCEK